MIASRKVGRFEVRAYSAGTLLFSIPQFMDDHPVALNDAKRDENGNVRFGTNFLHVRTPKASIMIDPGGWSAEHVQRLPELHPVPIKDNLAALGLDPAQVTHVLVSHGHPDHFQGVLAGAPSDGRLQFPNAQHHIHRLDLEGSALSDTDRAEVDACFGPIDKAGLLRVVEGYGAEIVEGVTMIHTGGESGGHCVVRIADDGKTFFYLADLLHVTEEARHLDWAMKKRNTGELVAGRRRVLAEAEARGAVLMFTHDPASPPWGAVTSIGVDRWGWQGVS
jgi:glyoxylase-like metal-dependent hydrolase (beta-lactamase superfamily II)